MSTISGVGGTSSAWSAAASSRAGAMRDRMFAKVDSDGSGSVDQTELQSRLDHIGSRSGTTAGNAADLLSKMDSDGSGSLSQGELEAGMKDLMPPPSSTVAFAQQRGGDRKDALFSKVDSDGSGGISSGELNQLLDKIASDGGASSSAGSSADAGSVAAEADAAVFKALDTDSDGSISASEFKAATAAGGTPRAGGHESGPHGGGMPPPPPADAAASGGTGASSASVSSATDPLDTNEDGVVSAQERAAGELKDLMQAMDADGDGSVSKSEIGSFIGQLQAAGADSGTTQGGDASSSSSSGSGGEAAASTDRGHFRLSALRDLVRNAYAAAQAEAQGSSLSVAA